MTTTVTICAYDRPDYLLQVLESLHAAMELCPEFQINRILLGIDHGGMDNEVLVQDSRVLEVIRWPQHLGVSEHPRRLLQHVFMELRSDFNLHLEDDTVLAPDALRLVEWFRSLMPDPAHILSLHSHVLPLHPDDPHTEVWRPDPALVKPRDTFGVWGWATTAYVARRYILPWWNHRREEPIGWDWSLTDTVRRHGLKVLSPALSRVRNIGRDGGVHATPETWDADHKDELCANDSDMRQIGDFHL